MPLFNILRKVPGMTRAGVDAAAFRALTCTYDYDDLRWVRSYWDEALGELRCIYEARDAGQVRDHARRSRIPCDDVREITEILPAEYADETPSVLRRA